MKILVVDDEALLVKGIRFNLQNEGYDNVTLFLQDDYIEQSFEGKEMWHEVFSDGLHKTDLGYYSVSKGLYNLINNNF